MRVRRAGLGEHGAERDDVAGRDIPVDSPVGPSAPDHVPDRVVDPFLEVERRRVGNRRPTVQWQDELVAQIDRGLDEAPQSIDPARGVPVGGLRIGEHPFERAVGEVGQELFPRGEVTVQGSNADTGIGRDRCHRHPKAIAVYGGGRGSQQGFAIDCGVRALLAYARRPPGNGHGFIKPPASTVPGYA